jgi:hypothetical protein
MGLQGLNLRQLQAELEAYLHLDAWFIRIPIITEDLGDVVNIADQAVAKLNTCVVVETSEFDDTEPNVPPVRGEVGISISVWENVSINRNPEAPQVHASDTAQVILALVKRFTGSAELNLGSIFGGTMKLLEINRSVPVTAYVCRFKALSGFSYEPTAAAGGILSESPSTVQILGEAGIPTAQG